MALNFANNNSLSAITSLPASISGGVFTLLQTQTASSSSTIDFTSNIDSTYDAYMFKFYNIHASADAFLSFQADTGTNTNYNQPITSTFFSAFHDEAGSYPSLNYRTDDDVAQSTSDVKIGFRTGNDDADMNICGTMQVYNPSSSTFVKNFMTRFSSYDTGSYECDTFVAGYINTTTAITRFRFKMNTGNIDSGVIKLYGIS